MILIFCFKIVVHACYGKGEMKSDCLSMNTIGLA